jgi:3-hydroxyisobutyrate dehydrogenase-like beta-hydroxyacid dehydrogenase
MENSSQNENALSIGMIGFGEAGQAFWNGWTGDDAIETAFAASVFDIKTAIPGPVADAKRVDYAKAGVAGVDDAPAAVASASVVFSLVTADQALTAAKSAAPGLRPGTLYFDCNSCAPQTKQAASKIIDAAGGRYIDVAVMAPVEPKRHKVPLLVSGPAVADALAVMTALGMAPQDAGNKVGAASSNKLVRSIMVKGMEALAVECFLAGRMLGVEENVLESLEKSNPGYNWREKIAYNFDRVMVHGKRRASEMRESAAMIEALGLPARMATATADWEQHIGDLALAPGEPDVGQRADIVLAALSPKPADAAE